MNFLSIERIAQIFSHLGAIITDSHFVLKSGRHASTYVNKDAIMKHPRWAGALCRHIAFLLDSDSALAYIDVVVGPSLGAISFSWAVAMCLSEMREQEVLSVFTEEGVDDQLIFKRGYKSDISGANVLVVEDILTTGGSAKKVVEAVQTAGGNVMAVVALCNRGGVTAHDLGASKLITLLDIEAVSYPSDQCPLCQSGIPVNIEYGHGRQFLASQPH